MRCSHTAALMGQDSDFPSPCMFQRSTFRPLHFWRGSRSRVTTKSGQRAVIEIVREFHYPTQFQPPQIPQSVGSLGTGAAAVGATTSVPVTPTTPAAFETRKTGVTLEVEPVVGPDGVTIDLNLVPQVVEFEGFINYGSPILAPPPSPLRVWLVLLRGIVSSRRT